MASFSFDVFVGDVIRSLLSGSKLVLCPLEKVMDPEQLYALMVEEARIFGGSSLERVIFAVYGSEAYEAFSSALSSPLPDGS